MFNLQTGVVRKALAALGIDPEAMARAEVKRLVRERLLKIAPKVAKRMVREGWTVTAKGETETIRDAVFRIFREGVFTFSGGGRLADLLRDSLDDAVVAELAEPVTDATPQLELVTRAVDAIVEQVF